jgi:UDP-4-amino-4,6-dideoxy-N-acetyl-beta-L-altrosamine transaminase
MKSIPYGHQSVSREDVSAVSEALQSDYLTTGPKVAEFESVLCSFTSAKHAVAVNSGTSALDISVAALQLPAGSEIITTPFTFAASANCALYNSCKPVFADIDSSTLNLDPSHVEGKITKKTRAIVCVDYAGQPCQIDALSELAEKHSLALIEDAAHSLGAEYNGRKVGTLAGMTTLSFHPVKHITTGEGGAVCTDDERLASRLRMLRNHGIDKTPQERASYLYDMKMLGRNYRITDFQCALGISQMGRLPQFLARRRGIAKLYEQELASVKGVSIPAVLPAALHAYHLYPILLEEPKIRDRVFESMRRKGIGVNVHYIPIYRFSYYAGMKIRPQDYPNTEGAYSRILSLPMYPDLPDEGVLQSVSALRQSIMEAKA